MFQITGAFAEFERSRIALVQEMNQMSKVMMSDPKPGIDYGAMAAHAPELAGVTKAALDAQCLADALVAAGNDIEPALAHYDTERRQFGRSLVARARHLGAYLEAHQTQNKEERCQTHLTLDPASFMRDYGAEELIRNNARGSPIAHRKLS